MDLGEGHRVADGIVAVVEQQLRRAPENAQTVSLIGRTVLGDDDIACAKVVSVWSHVVIASGGVRADVPALGSSPEEAASKKDIQEQPACVVIQAPEPPSLRAGQRQPWHFEVLATNSVEPLLGNLPPQLG